MGKIYVEESAVVEAPLAVVYGVIADYEVGHPAILPKPFFESLTVEEGGQGAGTVIRIHMNVFGTKAIYRQVITEPEPGRVLVEDDVEAGVKSTFIVDPLNGGQYSKVTIQSEFRLSKGLRGFMERLTNPIIMRHIFKKELRQLNNYVKTKGTTGKLAQDVS